MNETATPETTAPDTTSSETTALETTSTPETSTPETALTGETTGTNDATNVDNSGDLSDNNTQYSDFDLPDGFQLSESMISEISPVLKDIGATQEQAQSLVDAHAKLIQDQAAVQTEAFNDLIDGWYKESLTDKEFGGDNFDKNISVAKQAIDKFGTPELATLLKEHGIGNHPEMIRLMYRVGRLTTEDDPTGVNTQSGGGAGSKDVVSTMYPNG